jgi:hypothetical protein
VRRTRRRGAEQREPPVLAGAVHAAVARVAEGGGVRGCGKKRGVGAAEHRGRLGRAHVALHLHLPPLLRLGRAHSRFRRSLSFSTGERKLRSNNEEGWISWKISSRLSSLASRPDLERGKICGGDEILYATLRPHEAVYALTTGDKVMRYHAC